MLLTWGTLLVLVGFFHGFYYAGTQLFANEASDVALLTQMTSGSRDVGPRAVQDYALLQGQKAVNVAAHSHIIEFGMLAILMAFFQPYVFLSERWRKIWVATLARRLGDPPDLCPARVAASACSRAASPISAACSSSSRSPACSPEWCAIPARSTLRRQAPPGS